MTPMDRKRPVDTHIGQRLKEYRQLRGMTVRELADAAHVTPGQISHYEHGRDRISHERVTEFARILRINSNDLYQPPGSRLRRNHVRWRLTNFMAAVIAEAAALMSSWRKAAAGYEATINGDTRVAAFAAAVGASAAAASRAGAGTHATKTAWHVSDDGRGGKIAHDSPVSATGKDTSAQSTPASANGDHSASPFKPTVDQAAALMSSWRKAAADNEATMVNEATLVAAVARTGSPRTARHSPASDGDYATKTAWHAS